MSVLIVDCSDVFSPLPLRAGKARGGLLNDINQGKKMTQAHRQTVNMLIKVRDDTRRKLGLEPDFNPGADLQKIANTPFRVWRMIMSTAECTAGHFDRQDYIRSLAESIGRSLQQQGIFKKGVTDADSN